MVIVLIRGEGWNHKNHSKNSCTHSDYRDVLEKGGDWGRYEFISKFILILY